MCHECGERDWTEEIYLWRSLTDSEEDTLKKAKTSEEVHALLELVKEINDPIEYNVDIME
jgi:hypothetical protein